MILEKLMNYMIPDDGTKKYTKETKNLIYANEKAKERRNIFLLMKKYGTGFPKYQLKTYRMMYKSMKLVRKSYLDLKYNPKNPKIKADKTFIDALTQYIKDLGVLNIGFTKVPRETIFKNHSIQYGNSIVLSIEMNKDIIDSAPDYKSGHEVFDTYHKTGVVANKIARFLRKHGYGAQASPGMGGDVLFPELAEKAGMGALGLSDLLISPNIGPRQRLAAVFTSIENLPFFEEDNPYLWIRDFCNMCNRCVRECPGGALKNPPIADKYQKCAKTFSDLHGCSICIKECVFNLHGYEKIKKGFDRAKRKY